MAINYKEFLIKNLIIITFIKICPKIKIFKMAIESINGMVKVYFICPPKVSYKRFLFPQIGGDSVFKVFWRTTNKHGQRA